jgi:hypothetical protein
MRINLRLAGLVGVALIFLLALSCDFLFPKDTVPPQVLMLNPLDSALVNGVVTLRASAFDSTGVSKVEFLVDTSLVGTAVLVSGNYELAWNSSVFPAGTWHLAYARGTDLAGNVGYSDTVQVVTTGVAEIDVLHAEFTVPAGNYVWLTFSVASGDSLIGDARVTNGTTLSDFFWCDSANFALFQSQQNFTALDRQQNVATVSVASLAPVAGTYDMVFGNTSTGAKTVWARFSLRRHS